MKMKRTVGLRVALCAIALFAAVLGFATPGTAHAEGVIARIGDTGYPTLQDAIEAAPENKAVTIELLADVTEPKMDFTQPNRNITIDLAGHTFSATTDDVVSIKAPNLTLAIKNGSLVNVHEGEYSDGIYVYGNSSDPLKGSDNLNLALEGVELHSRRQAFGVNGQNKGTMVSISGCTIKADEENAIYYPPKGTLNIRDSIVTGTTGIYIKGGTVNIDGSSVVSGTGEETVPEDYYQGQTGNVGINDTGDAIYVEGGYEFDTRVNISGGTFKSANAQAVRYFLKSDDKYPEVKRSIEISGGVFSTEPKAEFIAKDHMALRNPDGTFEVVRQVAAPQEEDNAQGGVALVPDPVLKPSIDQQAAQSLARQADTAAESLLAGNGVAGVTVKDEEALEKVAKEAETAENGKLVAVLAVDASKLAEAPQADAGLVEEAKTAGETASYLDLSVNLHVTAYDEDGNRLASSVSAVTDLSELMEITVSAGDADLSGSVRVARVHDGVVDFIPCAVDREARTVTFSTDRFSTYALLTSSTATVRFETNGGSAVEPQTVAFGGCVVEPKVPVREGYEFAGWFADESLAKPFDFAVPVTTDTPDVVVYAKWNAVQQPGGGQGQGQNQGQSQNQNQNQGAEGKEPQKQPGGKLPSTGDASMLPVALAGIAGVAVLGAVASRRRFDL